MRIALLIAGPVFSAVAIATVLPQFVPYDGSSSTRNRYLPEYTASGDPVLPRNLNERVFVGSPLAPNAFNYVHRLQNGPSAPSRAGASIDLDLHSRLSTPEPMSGTGAGDDAATLVADSNELGSQPYVETGYAF